MIGIDSREESASCAVARGNGNALPPSGEISCVEAVAAPAALCLMDERGSVIASNPVGREWLNGMGNQALLQDAVRRTLAGDSVALSPTEFPHDLQFDRLDSLSGPLVLITVRKAESHAPTVLDALTQLPDRRALE